jgi:hypothetical protein
LKKGESFFQRKSDIMVQVWKDKRLVQVISTIHDSRMVNIGRKGKKSNPEVKKQYCIVRYNKFMEGVDRADQYLSYYSVLRKTVKWSKKMVLYLINCTLFNASFILQNPEYTEENKYKKFLHEVVRS